MEYMLQTDLNWQTRWFFGSREAAEEAAREAKFKPWNYAIVEVHQNAS